MMPIIRRIGGMLLFVIGIVSLILPVLPGWILIILGLYVLSIDSRNMHERLRYLRGRYVVVDRILYRLEVRGVIRRPDASDIDRADR